jgi:hypothetical protein
MKGWKGKFAVYLSVCHSILLRYSLSSLLGVSSCSSLSLFSLPLSRLLYICISPSLTLSLLFSSLFVSSGQKSIRPYWRNYYDQTDALVNNALHSTLFYSVLYAHLTEQMHWYCTRCDSFFFIASYSTLLYNTLLYWHFTLYTSCCIIVFYIILSSLLLSSNYPRPPSSTSSPSYPLLVLFTPLLCVQYRTFLMSVLFYLTLFLILFLYYSLLFSFVLRSMW